MNEQRHPSLPPLPEDLPARLSCLRARYTPYLRSLPPPFTLRRRIDLSGIWRWRWETEDFQGGARPNAPPWYCRELDDSSWQMTDVPDWRYDAPAPLGTTPDPNVPRPDSRILWYRTSFAAPDLKKGYRAFLVFAGAYWEAEVWLNGVYLGNHSAYWEAFRFEVTNLLAAQNTLAVRLLAGPKLGEPAPGWTTYNGWTVLPCALAVEPRHVRDAARSVIGQREIFGFKGSCFGTGIGLHREVYLEITADIMITDVFARYDFEKEEAKIQVEIDALAKRRCCLAVEIIPENFDGRSYGTREEREVPRGRSVHEYRLAMPSARLWQPEDPALYRCAVKICDGSRAIEIKEVLFGCRSFRLATKRRPMAGVAEGLFLLNEKPIFLRGAVVSTALNAFWYWRQEERLVDTILLAKAAGINAFRAGEHVQFAEVREFLDRLGMMSEQDLVAVPCEVPLPPPAINAMADLSRRLARVCYNNPGVVLLTVGGTEIEKNYDPGPIVAAVLKADPERVMKPISGHMANWDTAYNCPPPDYPTLSEQQWENVVNDFHCYNGWYRRDFPFWRLSEPYAAGRPLTVGEFGAEALDAYETMERYPVHIRPPAPEADELWGHAQVEKKSAKMLIGGRGQLPRCLAEYIAASQRYQADVIAEQATAFRLSPQRIAGHFVFHFIDGLPAEWPKSIVSFNGTPKKAYWAVAQIYQPLVPLFRVTGGGRQFELWVANDRQQALGRSRLIWQLAWGEKVLAGEERVDILPLNAVFAKAVELPSDWAEADVVRVALFLQDADGNPLAQQQREIYLPAYRQPSDLEEPPSPEG